MLEQSEIKTPEYVSLKYAIAGIGSRGAAFIIDQLIIATVYIIIFISMFFVFESSFFFIPTDQQLLWFLAIIVIFVFVLEWSYFVVQEFFWNGKTIGKRIIGLRVIQDNGHRITLLSSIIRNLLRIIDSLPTSYLLGLMLIFFQAKHQRLGDLAAGTIVVHDERVKKKKIDPVEKQMRKSGIVVDNSLFAGVQLNQITEKDFELVKTYCQRYQKLPHYELNVLTRQVGAVILPKLNMSEYPNHPSEIEKILFNLYLVVKDDWSY
ncbi:Uncharacterized membrane protein YckC, RDD family [Amphibacillus marinus]|uniref:Uncharacterized membrane protein YckC, RDD family n=1 Tax=Amphibacillus marinus TaxID=872970 RepID=A0A1H8RDE3_9BACI|nr:RDD family protein [Amphibacillus marinus]SEO64475.1 Uncharacterized membrane protein YckC, RDD family [Amphibacillus marinus]